MAAERVRRRKRVQCFKNSALITVLHARNKPQEKSCGGRTQIQGHVQDLSLGARSKGRRKRAGVGFLGRGSNPPPPPARRSGSAVSYPSGVRAEPRPPKGFPIFAAPRMASPHTIILLIVDYHAAIVGTTPVPSCLHPCAKSHQS